MNDLICLNVLNIGAQRQLLVRRRPEHSISRQIDIQSLPAITAITANHEVSGAARPGGVAAGDIAKAGEYRAMIGRMMDEGPYHRIEVVR